VPTALVVALAAPADTPVSFHEGLADGLAAACAELAPGCGVVGGDLSVSDTLTIAVTAFGDLEGRAPVVRSGAQVGDVVAVAGALGLAGAGLRMLFENGLRDISPLRGWAEVEAQLQPRPPIALGPVAALAGATSMIDLSDGLALDAARVAAASGVAIALDALSADELHGGEDHALLATFGESVPEGFREVGRVVAGSGLLVDGRVYEPGGWDPFTGWDGGLS
jgi:thiamine-monophosphate kinase